MFCITQEISNVSESLMPTDPKQFAFRSTSILKTIELLNYHLIFGSTCVVSECLAVKGLKPKIQENCTSAVP